MARDACRMRAAQRRGILLSTGDHVAFLALPGVPHEMRGLAEEFFASHRRTVGVPHQRTFFAGLGESTLQERLADLTVDSADCRVGVYCHDAGHLEVVTVGNGAATRATAIRNRGCRICLA